ncbi:MAG: hypothetical protein GC162_05775 [Planctomycetes bacterium]|nr:hypothetical protein [Planctomycetota bacterium]
MKLNSKAGRHVAWVEVNPSSPPAVVHAKNPRGPEVEYYLDWDRAIDDEGHLRKCPACGCADLYRRSACPPLTGFIFVLIVGLICLALWGLADAPLGMIVAALAAVAVANVVVIVIAPRHLVCYRCGSAFYQTPLSRGHVEWDSATAERYGESKNEAAETPA